MRTRTRRTRRTRRRTRTRRTRTRTRTRRTRKTINQIAGANTIISTKKNEMELSPENRMLAERIMSQILQLLAVLKHVEEEIVVALEVEKNALKDVNESLEEHGLVPKTIGFSGKLHLAKIMVVKLKEQKEDVLLQIQRANIERDELFLYD